MKTTQTQPPFNRSKERAFTMVEIVLSLAIIAVALVAIIGVLPIGLNVQSDNKEESIISADAAIWTQFLSTGAQGGQYFEPDATTKKIFYISEVRLDENVRTRNAASPILFADIIKSTTTKYITTFDGASNLLGVLSLPKYPTNWFELQDGAPYTNWNVYADVRALNGNMADLGGDMDFAFKYRMTPELVPLQAVGPATILDTNSGRALPNLAPNVYELRLLFQWPLLPGPGGDYRGQTNFAKSMTFRTIVGGHDNWVTNANLTFMSAHEYTGYAAAEPKSNP